MVVLWFVIGILVITGIARYNASNQLFWQLFLAFLLGFAVTKMVMPENQSNTAFEQVYPTQVSSAAQSWAIIAHTSYAKDNNVVTAQPAVSQEYTPALPECSITSKTCGKVRDQPQEVITNPPETCLTKDFLTLHDHTDTVFSDN